MWNSEKAKFLKFSVHPENDRTLTKGIRDLHSGFRQKEVLKIIIKRQGHSLFYRIHNDRVNGRCPSTMRLCGKRRTSSAEPSAADGVGERQRIVTPNGNR